MKHLLRLFPSLLGVLVLASALAPSPLQAGESRSLRRARILYKSGKYHDAIQKLREALVEDSRDAEAHLWLGKSYLRVSEPGKAAESLEEARKLTPQNEETYRALGTAYLELETRSRAQGEHAAAKRHLARAEKVAQDLLDRKPKEKESYEFLVELAERQRRLEDAIAYCRQVLEIDPNDVSTHLKRITILVKQKKLDEAEKRCNEVLAINPKLHGPKLTLARIFQARGDNDGAIKVLSEIIEQRKTHLEARLRRAEIYLGMQNYEKALEDADAVARIQERHPYAHFIRGAVYMQLKKPDDAIEEFLRAVAHPAMEKHFACHFWLARCLLVKERLRDAIDSLNKAVAANPEFIPARLILASTHLQQGYPDGAIEVLVDAHQIAPDNTEVLRLLGVAFLHKGDHTKAHMYFAKMLELDPDSARANQILAGIALAKGQVDQAIQYCLKALQSEAKNIDILFLLGLAYLQKGRLDGAEAQFERVLALRNRHPGARINLARVHLRRRKYDLAEEQLTRCIQEDPGLTEPRYRLAALYIRQRDFDKAKSQLDEVLKLEEKQARGLTAMAELHFRRGDTEEALAAARRALAADPDHLAAHLLIAAVHRRAQNWASALTELQAALKKNPKFAPAYEAAVIQMHMGQYREARALFDKALRNDVAPRRTLLGAAAANQFLGDYQAARANISLIEKMAQRSAIVSLLNANIYLASGDSVSARAIVKRPEEGGIPEHIRDAYLALIDKFANNRPRLREAADMLTAVIFFASRGWHEEAERSAKPLVDLAPDNTFVPNILANVYLLTGEEDKYVETIEKLMKLAPKEPRYLIQLAGIHLARGDFKAGRAALERAAEVSPDTARPRVALAAYFSQTAQYEQAIEQAEKALNIEDDNEGALQILADSYRRTGQLDKARDALQRLAKSSGSGSGNPRKAATTRLQIAGIHLVEGKAEEAIEIYKSLLKQKAFLQQPIMIHLGLAAAYQQQRKFTESIEQLKLALTLDSAHSGALLQLATIYRLTGRPHLALETAERAATVSPSARAVRLELAAIHMAMNNHQLAIDEYKKLLKDYPNDIRARLSIAEVHFRADEKQTAIKQMASLLENNPSLLPVRARLVSFYKRLGQVDKALPELEALVRASPQMPGAPDLIVAYIHQGRLDDASAIVTKAAQVQPVPILRIAQAVLHQLDNQPKKAVEILAQVQKENAKNAHVASLLANALLADGQAAQAKKIMEDVEFSERQLESKGAYVALIDEFKNPGDVSRNLANTLNLGALYADSGWYVLARQAYEKLPEAVRNNLAILHMIAHASEQLADTPGAITAYERMLVKQPNYPFALLRLTQHYARTKDYPKAEGVLRKLLKADPRNIQLQIQLATVLQQQKKTEEAIERYRSVIRQTQAPIAYNNLAWIYTEETNNLVEAEALAQRAVKLTSADSAEGGAVRDTLAWIHYRNKKYDDANKYAQEAITAMPGSAEVRYHLGMILFERQLRASAARQLMLALKLDPEFEHKAVIEDVLDRIRRGLPSKQQAP